jgi:hypothetical protein
LCKRRDTCQLYVFCRRRCRRPPARMKLSDAGAWTVCPTLRVHLPLHPQSLGVRSSEMSSGYCGRSSALAPALTPRLPAVGSTFSACAESSMVPAGSSKSSPRQLTLRSPSLGGGLPPNPPPGPVHKKVGARAILNPRLAAGGSPRRPMHAASPGTIGMQPAAARAPVAMVAPWGQPELPVQVKLRLMQQKRRPARWVEPE